MIGNKLVIGVCLTKLQDLGRSEYLTRLFSLAQKQDCKLMIFTSFLDFGNHDAFDDGAKTVYNLMDFDMLDAVIVLMDSFADKSVAKEIAARARAGGVPVLLIGGESNDCLCIRKVYHDEYKAVMNHVIREHGITDTYFMGGLENNPDTEARLRCYQEVLKENGIPYDPKRVGYGSFWSLPASNLVRGMVSNGGKPPKAIFCANDHMAFAVCDTLREYGYRVPQDVIVTGFDGVPGSEYFYPCLTTCNENLDGLAELSLELAIKAIKGEAAPGIYEHHFYPVFSESCGCLEPANEGARMAASKLYQTVSTMDSHEDYLYEWLDQLLGMDDMSQLNRAISMCLLNDSYVCLNKEIDAMEMEKDIPASSREEKELTVIPSANLSVFPGQTLPLQRQFLVPSLEFWAPEESVYVFSAVYVGKKVCGYYAVRTAELAQSKYQIKRVQKILNIAFGSALNYYHQKRMKRGLENAMLTDPITQLPNMKGAMKWFDGFASKEENRNRFMTLAVYGMPKYTYIYDHYGMGEVEEHLIFVAETLRKANMPESFIAHIADDEFMVIDTFERDDEIGGSVDRAMQNFFGQVEQYNETNSKEYYLEVNSGCSVVNPGWDGSLESYVKYAVGEMYLNRMRYGEGKVTKEDKESKDFYSAFNLLLEKNLFTYHFQPIVDAKTGNIFAYEALMRTSGGITMSPLDVLDVAKQYGRLYEIEKATLFNIMRLYVERREEFGDHLLFINTIPGHFLNDEDCAELMAQYGDYMDHVVFELTEQNTISDRELEAIRRMSKDGNACQIAVDDYGTGHSNIVNLLRYSPQVIKIDRYLISEIQNDTNKQMFVKNTIEFAKLNGIKTLAEGVETSEELQKVIEYGMDMVQGYYLGRPIADPIPAIRDEVKNEIVGKNVSMAKFDSEMRAYSAKPGETIYLLEMAINKFGFIDVPGGEVTIIGEKDHTVDIVLRVADNAKSSITLVNVNIKGSTETTVQLGTNCNVKLVLVGENTLKKEGILVPASSSLLVMGEGNLTVINSRNDSVGIGANYDNPYGTLTFDMSGMLTVNATGDRVVGIGGGRNEGKGIRFVNGAIRVAGTGISVVGIGSANGHAEIDVENAEVKVKCVGDEAVSIGSINGSVNFSSTGLIETVTDCERAVGIGTLSSEKGELSFTAGKISAINHCYNGTCIGSFDGVIDVRCLGAIVDVYGEASSICGIGSLNASASITISAGTVSVGFLAAEIRPFGSPDTQLTINGGNVLAPDYEVTARNFLGEQLYPKYIKDDNYERQITLEYGSYIYRARRDAAHDQLCVFLPQEYLEDQ